jgi:hypothetical protein
MVRCDGDQGARRNAIATSWLALIVPLVFLSSGAGCGGGASQTPAASQAMPNGISVALAPANTSVLLGKTMTLTATVSNATNAGVSWSVENIPGGNTTVGATQGIHNLPMSEFRQRLAVALAPTRGNSR